MSNQPASTTSRAPLLSVRHLTTRFRTDRGVVTAVDDVSFDVFPGETLAIVGESGCGKTVTSKSILRLLPPRIASLGPASSIVLGPRAVAGAGTIGAGGGGGGAAGGGAGGSVDLARADEATLRRVRGARIAMIFQEPMTSLNPVFTVGWQIEEALKYHTRLDRAGRRARVIEMLKLVEIPEPQRRAGEYPHQLSGGMRQRVMIAIALCCEPDLLIADEPTTALDVTIQAQILKLMDDLRRRLGTAIMLITHNLGVVAQVCDRVIVMYAGRIAEQGPVRAIFHHPRHPYTAALLRSIPRAGQREPGRRLAVIEGIVPGLHELPPGCRFQDRCPYRQDRCVAEEPSLRALDAAGAVESGPADAGTPLVRCHFPLAEARVPAGAGPGRGSGREDGREDGRDAGGAER